MGRSDDTLKHQPVLIAIILSAECVLSVFGPHSGARSPFDQWSLTLEIALAVYLLAQAVAAYIELRNRSASRRTDVSI